jgi:ATP-dependent Lon protease
MDFPFEQISMGNVTNAEILTGHQYTYVGSRPGAILNALTDMKYKNGIIFLDEFDKVQNVDISNTLLHIVDTTQNHQYVDNYLGQQIKIDLSNIWFIFAMNNVPESGPLRDRIFVIEIDGYNMNEKCIITRDYLLPRVCKNVGLQPTDVCINEDVTRYLVTKFTTPDEMDNQGVRYIEKKLTDFINKIMFLVNTGSCFTDLIFSIKQQLTYPVNISRDLIDSLLTTSTKITPYRHMYS